MWRYEQSTGYLWHRVAVGYSGHDEGKNQPDLDSVRGIGPIPRGRWSIGPPQEGTGHGPYVMRLTPDPDTVTHGRSGFLIHGDMLDPAKRGEASEGCIILDPVARHAVWESGDHELEVVP